jgi:putative acetyltransferase
MVEIRTERAEDHAAVRAVNEEAFGQPAEARLVDALRADAAFRPELSLVAVDAEQVVGHPLMTVAALDSGAPVLALAPMAVRQTHQRTGVGTALVEEGIRRARETTIPLIVVLGHPEYYPRFGFRPARELDVIAPFDVPDEAWMALPLPTWTPEVRGTVALPAPIRAGRLIARPRQAAGCPRRAAARISHSFECVQGEPATAVGPRLATIDEIAPPDRGGDRPSDRDDDADEALGEIPWRHPHPGPRP